MPLRLGIFGSTVSRGVWRSTLILVTVARTRRRCELRRRVAKRAGGQLYGAREGERVLRRILHREARQQRAPREANRYRSASFPFDSVMERAPDAGQFQCSFCSEETDFYDVQFEDTHWSVVPRQNMSPSGRRMTAEEVEEMERLQAAVTHLKVKFRAEIKFSRCAYPPRYRRDTGQVRPHQQGPGLQGEEHTQREPLEVL